MGAIELFDVNPLRDRRGGQKPGFWRKSFAVAVKLIEKPGFFGQECVRCNCHVLGLALK